MSVYHISTFLNIYSSFHYKSITSFSKKVIFRQLTDVVAYHYGDLLLYSNVRQLKSVLHMRYSPYTEYWINVNCDSATILSH